MDSTQNFLDEMNEQVRQHVQHSFKEVRADKLGLDIRAGYRLFINDEAIAVSKNDDRSLQYYGGFEYVDKEYRLEVGDYVFYVQDDDRVTNCIERWQEEETVEE